MKAARRAGGTAEAAGDVESGVLVEDVEATEERETAEETAGAAVVSTAIIRTVRLQEYYDQKVIFGSFSQQK